MLHFVLGCAGSGKSRLLMEKVRQTGSDKKIIYIVPEQFSFDNDKKLYEFLGTAGFNNIFSLSFTSLAKEIFENLAENPENMLMIYRNLLSCIRL